ncbi:MAG: outer membrane beta-barrel protein [Bacteroidales bacterium]|nr:outer membrane beta-barrel protein [Bacteroidales bacterium]
MKAKKSFLIIALAVFSAGASAQFTTNGGSTTFGLVKDCAPYNRFYASYNPHAIKTASDVVDNRNFTGFSVGYTHGFSVSEQLPFFVELGARFNYSFKNEDSSDYDANMKYKYMNVAVPVNLAYKLTFPNGKVSISPYLGLTLKYNIEGKVKIDFDSEYLKLNDIEVDCFDKEDMKEYGSYIGSEKVFRRIQIGWQVGAGFSYNALYLGLHYGCDFGEITKNAKISNWGLSIGANF